MAKRFRGITEQQEFRNADALRDLRPFWQQVRDLIKNRWGAMFFLCMFAALMSVAPSFSDLLFLLGLLVFWYSVFGFVQLPYKLPAYSGLTDPHDTKAGSNIPGPAAGIYFFGNDIDSR